MDEITLTTGRGIQHTMSIKRAEQLLALNHPLRPASQSWHLPDTYILKGGKILPRDTGVSKEEPANGTSDGGGTGESKPKATRRKRAKQVPPEE